MGIYIGPDPNQLPVPTGTGSQPVFNTAPPFPMAPTVVPVSPQQGTTPPTVPPAATIPPPSWGQGPPASYDQPPVPQAGVSESRAPGFNWEDFTRDNSGMLIGAGTALMANAQNPLANPMTNVGQAALQGGALDTLRREKTETEKQQEAQKNATIEWLVKYRGMTPEQAKATVDAGMVSEALAPPKDTSTDDMREYNQAVAQGFTGTFLDYQIKMKEAGRAQTTVNLGEKLSLPAGWKWNDPDNPRAGMSPIEGGPGTQMPAELAARVGMADSFLEQAPTIRDKIAAGKTTGVWDRAKAGFDSSSEQAEVMRQMKSGTDALQRMLTGAGMPASEAAAYADRYLPTYTDNAESAARKLDQLVMELQRIKDMAMRGRGGSETEGSATGGAAGTTSGGLKWSVEP